MTAAEYLKENSDWFDKSPGGEKLYFESEVIRMMENYSSQIISDEEIEKEGWKYCYENKISLKNIVPWINACEWYREQLKNK